MVARTESLFRRALSAPGPVGGGPVSATPAQVFTQGFLNASMLQMALCAPPRAAARTREIHEIYITEPGAQARPRKDEHSTKRAQPVG